MNSTETNTIRNEVQNLSINELASLSSATRRVLETLEAVTFIPRCQESESLTNLLDDQLDRLGEYLDVIAAEMIERVPANEGDESERHFSLMHSACASRMTFQEFLEFHKSESGEERQ